MNQPRVLIVDDDPALLQALPEALRLRMNGVTVDTADSATAALDRIAARDYDAIVTDIKMPGMDGFALLAEIRARRPDTPTLMITGHGEHALAIGALRGGAYDFIQKPIDREYFVTSLRKAIEVGELGRRAKEQQLPLRWLIGPSRQMEKVVEQIKQVALNYGLLSAFTAYVAVDSTHRTDGTEGTTVPVAVPVPEGVKYDTTVKKQQAGKDEL